MCFDSASELGYPGWSTSGAAPITAQSVAQFETAKRFRSGTYTVFILPTHPPVEAHVKNRDFDFFRPFGALGVCGIERAQ
jgi:hypothetical protein